MHGKRITIRDHNEQRQDLDGVSFGRANNVQRSYESSATQRSNERGTSVAIARNENLYQYRHMKTQYNRNSCPMPHPE